jgi:diguanylate cyclase (GGDEF)-like protein/PAS domain S-box-containing protein
MKLTACANDEVLAENRELRARLEEAEETLHAIRNGEVDALVIAGAGGEQVYMLKGADHQYRQLIEDMRDGACLLTTEGMILYANRRLAEIIKMPLEQLIGASILDWITPPSRALLQALLRSGDEEKFHAEMAFVCSDGSALPVDVSVHRRVESDRLDYFSLVATDLREIKARTRAEADALASYRYTRSLIEASLDAVVTISPNGKIADVNRATEQATGLPRQQMIGSDFANHFTEPQQALACCEQAFAKGFVTDYPLTLMHTAGKFTDVLYNAAVFHDASGQIQGIFATAHDITERKKALSVLNLAANVFKHANEGIMITAADDTIIDVNESFTRITSYSRDEALGQNPRLLGSAQQDKSIFITMRTDLKEKGCWEGELLNRRKNGGDYVARMNVSAVRDAQDKVLQYVGFISDITASKIHEKKLERIAHYDALTQLPNRVLLADRMRQGLIQAQRRAQAMAVVYLDLDGFKAINDQYGHEVGDKLLIALASRLKEAIREGDTLARLGGDEFVAVLLDLDDDLDITRTCEPMLARLLAAASKPVQIGDLSVKVSASLGVTRYPQAEEVDPDQLLRQADQAMYQAKLAGKNRVHVFDTELDRSTRGRYDSLEHFRRALAENELLLHYQPKVNLLTGAVTGVEALIRWQHPAQGLLLPASFLPEIEQHPLAIAMGEWVIDQALTQIEVWRWAGLDIPVSVNIGARQLQQVDFFDRLRAILATHPQVAASCLELEILETSALEEIVQVSRTIAACTQLGVSFALDDFGTGYSSLTYLKRLKVKALKIDQSFVRDMLDDPDDMVILKGVISLAAAFGRDVIAEGVETAAHGKSLLQMGCQLAQGYGIARPMPAQDLPPWVAAWQSGRTWPDLAAVACP